jgi:hypothetical protein
MIWVNNFEHNRNVWFHSITTKGTCNVRLAQRVLFVHGIDAHGCSH